MERQINTLCSFTLGFITCQLPEDMVDEQVRVRTCRGTHTLKEDGEYHSLKFKPWGNTPKSFKTPQESLYRYIYGWDVDAVTTSATPINPENKDQERRRQPHSYVRCVRREDNSDNEPENYRVVDDSEASEQPSSTLHITLQKSEFHKDNSDRGPQVQAQRPMQRGFGYPPSILTDPNFRKSSENDSDSLQSVYPPQPNAMFN